MYFGGGTPPLLGYGVADLIRAAGESFEFIDPEITVEANPGDRLEDFFSAVVRAGANRLSLGVQSANHSELAVLGRRHSFADAIKTVKSARTAGFSNLSLDLMLGIPGQTDKTLRRTLENFFRLSPEHISAYILKIEENTPFYRKRETLNLPDEDCTAELYLQACEILEKEGYRQYEISNFARRSKKSRHNLKCWNCEEYLGLGPSAHSFMEGRRFYYPSDISAYMEAPGAVDDGPGGSPSEYAMLRLRLTDGIIFNDFKDRFGRRPFEAFIKKAEEYAAAGLCSCNKAGVRLTRSGFLVSNTVIGGLYENI